MTKYIVLFHYGKWKLWAEVESPQIAYSDKRGFADLAQNAVKTTLDSLTMIKRSHIAHDYTIFELPSDSEASVRLVYTFKTLVDE